MCLSIPAEIISVEGDLAIASINGVRLEISTQLVEAVKPGDYVLVHTGYALQVMDKEEFDEALNMQREIALNSNQKLNDQH